MLPAACFGADEDGKQFGFRLMFRFGAEGAEGAEKQSADRGGAEDRMAATQGDFALARQDHSKPIANAPTIHRALAVGLPRSMWPAVGRQSRVAALCAPPPLSVPRVDFFCALRSPRDLSHVERHDTLRRVTPDARLNGDAQDVSPC